MKTLDERWEKERRPSLMLLGIDCLSFPHTHTHRHTQKGTEKMKSKGDRSAAVTKRNRQKRASLKHLHYYDTPQSDTYWHFKHLPWRWKANTRIYLFSILHLKKTALLSNKSLSLSLFICLLLFKIKSLLMYFHDHLRKGWTLKNLFSFILSCLKIHDNNKKLYLFKMPNSSCVSVLSLRPCSTTQKRT